MEKSDLYKMKLLDREYFHDVDMTVVRVPGGWIFIDYNPQDNTSSQSQCFVPFDKGFKTEE